MKEVYTEKQAEDFLASRGFGIVEGFFVSRKKDLRKIIVMLGFPLVIKVSGKQIVHKNKVDGVITGVRSYASLEKSFEKLMRIPGASGVMIQRQLSGKEFLLGIKETPEFGKVIAFGAGGIHTEEKKDVSFRAINFFKEKDALEMISEINDAKKVSNLERNKIKEILLHLVEFARRYPRVYELDINPLINGKIVDARIVFHNI
ncbi:Acetate--CoA ligase [ADP-forming] II [uncultured archaeon]|nr:Acetate--CoA ligase [ADP-forming] II [uncultured archaeon]